MIRWLAAFSLALTNLAGCASPATAPPLPAPTATYDGPVDPIALCSELHTAAIEWSALAYQKFHDPVVIAVHGGECCGVWLCYPDPPMRPMAVQSLAQTLHAVYPHRDVVLLCCNPAGDRIHVAGVWYARKPVWCVPTPFRVKSADDVFGAATLDEFQCTP